MMFSKPLCASCDFSPKWTLGQKNALKDAKNSLFRHCVRKHMVVSDDEKLICDWCNLACIRSTELWIHIYNRHLSRDGENFFMCDIDTCQQQFYSKNSLKSHIVMRHLLCDAELERFLCENCGHFQERKSNIGQHIVDQHLYACLLFPCDECDRVWYTKKALRDHKRRKHGGSFVCYVCQKSVSQKGDLIKHMKSMHHY